mmetsp:Transcript_31304/g.50314  ORF Transcript_31304/g.50314 Transcript_31304/m.50314 type:complete len:234 (+) Transcript_31304:1214-1915(+)
MPKQVTTLSTLHSTSPAGPTAARVSPAYVCTSDCPATTLPSTRTSCALTSILSASSAKTHEKARHVDTSKVPPCANAHGSANPPAPKMALIVLIIAALSPVSPPFTWAGTDEAAAAVVTIDCPRRSPPATVINGPASVRDVSDQRRCTRRNADVPTAPAARARCAFAIVPFRTTATRRIGPEAAADDEGRLVTAVEAGESRAADDAIADEPINADMSGTALGCAAAVSCSCAW